MTRQRTDDLIKLYRPEGFEGLELLQGTFKPNHAPMYFGAYRVGITFEAGARVSYRGARYNFPANELYLIEPEQVIAGDTAYPHRSYVLDVEVGAMKRLLQQATGQDVKAPHFPKLKLPNRRLVKLFINLHRSFSGNALRLERETRLLDTVLELAQHGSDAPLKLPLARREREAVRRARSYIEAHYSEAVPIESLAIQTALGSHHLARVFKQEVGIAPHAYQVQLRIQRAKDLLRQGWSLVYVAASLGFADQSHFTRTFRRFVGVTPGYYRKQS